MNSAIATPNPRATAAGEAVLRSGGTAPEALIAAGAVLTVVMPHFCGLGGDAVWLLADRQGRRRALHAIGQGLDRVAPTGPIPMRGPHSVLTSAAVVAGWQYALNLAHREMGGKAHWEDLLAPAVMYAEHGFPVTPSQAFWTRFRHGEAEDWSGFAQIFLCEGSSFSPGQILRQPDLASTLRDLAERGSNDFYRGRLARRIVEGLQAQGVTISSEDLARTACREAVPLSLPYRGMTLLATPPPTQGLTTLQIMGQLARFDLGQLQAGSADHIHLCVEAVKRAFLNRGQIADPAFQRCDTDPCLVLAEMERMANGIALDRAMPWPHVWQHSDTVFLGAIDEMGNAASVLQSLYYDWGSGVVSDGTGILWQNRGAAFSPDIHHRNAFAPGKLPFYTLTPGLALRDGEPHLVYGTQGADGQPQTLSMLLTRLIDFRQSPEEALAAPRFLLGRTFSHSHDTLKLESDVGSDVAADLTARGHRITMIAAQNPLAGQAGIVRAGDGMVSACHDPRI